MSDQQEFPDIDLNDYADPENAEHETSSNTGLALPGQNLPDKVYIIPIHNRPFFPAQVLPVIVNEEPWAETLELVSKSDHHSLALFFMDTPPEDPRHFDTSALPLYGTLVKVHHASRENGKLQFVAQGLTRVRIKTWLKHHRPGQYRDFARTDRHGAHDHRPHLLAGGDLLCCRPVLPVDGLHPGARLQAAGTLAARRCLPIPPLRPGYRPQTLEFRAEHLQGSFSD